MTDFPELVERLAPVLVEKRGIADRDQRGGLESAVRAPGFAVTMLRTAGLGDRPIGVVTGDDVLGLIPEWIARD